MQRLPSLASSPLLALQQLGVWGSPHRSVSWQDWQVRYQQDTPVAPRFDINAPDLYIPGTLLGSSAWSDLTPCRGQALVLPGL